MVLPPPPLPPPPPPPLTEIADPRTRITQFVNAYDGGDCFFVEPLMVEDGDATLLGLGTSTSPSKTPLSFDVLNDRFKRQFGFEAEIGVYVVMAEQCPAVNFLSRTRNKAGAAPRLEVDATGLRSTPSGPLTGSVAEIGDRLVELLLVADDGYVHNLTGRLKQSGNTKTFSFTPVQDNPGPPQPQLLFAIASSRPLDALKLPQGRSRAEQVFAQLEAEILQRGQTVNVSWKWFSLEK
jgi:serine/threonine-protein kinase